MKESCIDLWITMGNYIIQLATTKETKMKERNVKIIITLIWIWIPDWLSAYYDVRYYKLHELNKLKNGSGDHKTVIFDPSASCNGHNVMSFSDRL